MGPVQFNINNSTQYSLEVTASNGADASINAGNRGQLNFGPGDTNITCAMKWYNSADVCILQGSVAWSAGGSGADDGWSSSSLVCMAGDFNGEGFGGCAEGWVEMQPYNLMANGGTINVHYTNP